jgi:beta-glucosidase
MARALLFALSAHAAAGAPAARGSAAAWPPSVYARAAATLSQMTLDEKIRLVSGDNAQYGKNCSGAADPVKNCAYVGWQHGVPRLGLADIYMEDGPQGVADGMTRVTRFPGVQTVAAAWDVPLARAFAAAMGAEQAAKGSSVMLGPAVALVRCPLSGRNFEYISEDPAYNAAVAAALVAGAQDGTNVSACVKHWIFNSQETNRTSMSTRVAERVGRELYEPPYAAAVDAGVGFVMCSFNRINGSTYSCANDAGLNQWLKKDLGFDG